MKRKLLSTDLRVLEAIQMYQSGVTFKGVLKHFRMDGASLNKFLLEKGIKKTRSEQVRKGKGVLRLKDEAFDLLTPEALYWIGFLYADGHIEKEPRPRISLSLAEKDRDHLNKLNLFIGGDLKIREVFITGKQESRGQINFDGRYYRAAFSSRRIYDKLVSLGFTHNKTYDLVPHRLLKDSRDFWRGVVDGDGWICMSGDKRAEGKYNYPIIGLSGTDETIKDFLYFVKLSGVATKAESSKKKGEVWQVDLHNTPAKQVLTLLYKDAPVYLDRKFKMYQQIIESPQPVS